MSNVNRDGEQIHFEINKDVHFCIFNLQYIKILTCVSYDQSTFRGPHFQEISTFISILSLGLPHQEYLILVYVLLPTRSIYRAYGQQLFLKTKAQPFPVYTCH